MFLIFEARGGKLVRSAAFVIRLNVNPFTEKRKMQYRSLLCLFLLPVVMAAAARAQSESKNPVTLSELRSGLTVAERSDALIESANRELIAAVKKRGVDFVLMPEDEWSLKLLEASDELIAAVHGAIDPEEREFRLTVARQQRLYNSFALNYNGTDLASRQTALSAAREFVGLYATDTNVAEIVRFMQRNLPRLEQSVAMLQQREAAMERARAESTEREQRRQQDRAERDRRRQEASAAREAARNGATMPGLPNTPTDSNPPMPQPPNNIRRIYPPPVRRP